MGRSLLWVDWAAMISIIAATVLLPLLLHKAFTIPGYYEQANPLGAVVAALAMMVATGSLVWLPL